MKRILYTLLLLAISLSAFSQGAPRQVPGTQGTKTHDEAKINSTIPAFQFATAAGKFITNADLPANKPVILALFSPTCDHCQRAVAAIKDKMNLFGDAVIIFVTSISNFSELENFEKILNRNEENNCEFNLSIDRQRHFLMNEFKNKYL